jgi:4-carboxymuconolactone decarboxylase
LDIGSAVGSSEGLGEEKILAVPRHRESAAFNELERRVLDYAEALTRTPAEASDAMVAELARELSHEGLVELTAAIAWENFRARFNRGFDVASQDFAEGAVCPIPDHAPPSSP